MAASRRVIENEWQFGEVVGSGKTRGNAEVLKEGTKSFMQRTNVVQKILITKEIYLLRIILQDPKVKLSCLPPRRFMLEFPIVTFCGFSPKTMEFAETTLDTIAIRKMLFQLTYCVVSVMMKFLIPYCYVLCNLFCYNDEGFQEDTVDRNHNKLIFKTP